MLGIFPGKKARFVRNFMDGQADIGSAVLTYIRAVKDQVFPALEHCY
jgi:3-methyl-2-oxobutanoate hydroxymethyltransferase